MKVLELLTLFNEVELLKVHLEEHWDYVDKFVISEAAHTYAKRPKLYYFLEHAEMFKPYMDKIQYMQLDMSDSLFWSDTRANQNIQQYWPLLRHPEFMEDYDYCVHNDLDEIIDRRHWPRLMDHLKSRPSQVSIGLRHFRNYLDWEFPSYIYHGFRVNRMDGNARFLVGRGDSPRALHVLPGVEPQVAAPTFGYHFTFMGGTDKVKYKLENFMHWRNVTPQVLSDIRPETYNLFYRDDCYGAPVVLADPKAEMPKAIQDNWGFFKDWCSTVPPIAEPKGSPSKYAKR
jgi:hypothetical protein